MTWLHAGHATAPRFSCMLWLMAQPNYPTARDEDSSHGAGLMTQVMSVSELVFVTMLVAALLIVAAMLYPA